MLLFYFCSIWVCGRNCAPDVFFCLARLNISNNICTDGKLCIVFIVSPWSLVYSQELRASILLVLESPEHIHSNIRPDGRLHCSLVCLLLDLSVYVARIAHLAYFCAFRSPEHFQQMYWRKPIAHRLSRFGYVAGIAHLNSICPSVARTFSTNVLTESYAWWYNAFSIWVYSQKLRACCLLVLGPPEHFPTCVLTESSNSLLGLAYIRWNCAPGMFVLGLPRHIRTSYVLAEIYNMWRVSRSIWVLYAFSQEARACCVSRYYCGVCGTCWRFVVVKVVRAGMSLLRVVHCTPRLISTDDVSWKSVGQARVKRPPKQHEYIWWYTISTEVRLIRRNYCAVRAM